MQRYTALKLANMLNLTRHPEGGWYRECYRSDELVPAAALPERFDGDRSFCTSIYFLLERGDVSCLHRIKSDEIWHFYTGSALTIHIITPDGGYFRMPVGPDLVAGESFQVVVPAGCWFGAEVLGDGDFSLVGCTVSPGFEFADFEIAEREALLRYYPEYEALIRRLTRD